MRAAVTQEWALGRTTGKHPCSAEDGGFDYCVVLGGSAAAPLLAIGSRLD